jgi:hypothetical protein
MFEFDFDALSALGLTPELANRAAGIATCNDERLRLMRVVEVNRESVQLHGFAVDFDHAHQPQSLVVAGCDAGGAVRQLRRESQCRQHIEIEFEHDG